MTVPCHYMYYQLPFPPPLMVCTSLKQIEDPVHFHASILLHFLLKLIYPRLCFNAFLLSKLCPCLRYRACLVLYWQ